MHTVSNPQIPKWPKFARFFLNMQGILCSVYLNLLPWVAIHVCSASTIDGIGKKTAQQHYDGPVIMIRSHHRNSESQCSWGYFFATTIQNSLRIIPFSRWIAKVQVRGFPWFLSTSHAVVFYCINEWRIVN